MIIYLPLRLPDFLTMFDLDVGKHVHQQAASQLVVAVLSISLESGGH